MNRTTEYSETSSKKGRGRAKKSLDLIEAMRAAAAAAHPITGRGIGYNLLTAGMIPSMARAEILSPADGRPRARRDPMGVDR